MGVQAAHPGKLVINIDGDGSFQMNSQELATCFAEGLPVKTVIINNSGHGMVRQWQRIIYKERYFAIDLPRRARTTSGSPRPTAASGSGSPSPARSCRPSRR